IAAFGALLADPIAAIYFKDPKLAGLLRLTCLGAFGSSLWMFCQAAMQARRQFGWYAALTTANHDLRLFLVLILFYFKWLDLRSAIVVAVAVPFFGLLSSGLLWPRIFWTAIMEQAAMRTELIQLFHISKWIFFSALIVSLILQIDRFLLLPLAGEV